MISDIRTKKFYGQENPRDQMICVLSGVMGHLSNMADGRLSPERAQLRVKEMLASLEEVVEMLREYKEIDRW